MKRLVGGGTTVGPAPGPRPATGAARRVPSPCPWGLLVVVLAGLFTMHGLGTHGTHTGHVDGAPQPSGQVVAAAAAPDAEGQHHAEHAMVGGSSHLQPVDALTVAAAAQLLPDQLPNGSGSGGLLGLCFALLTVMLALTAARRVPLEAVLPSPARAPAPRYRSRDRDPPPRSALSIWRC